MNAYIIDACRTPRGRRGGGLAGVHPIDLCTVPMHAIVARTGVDPTRIDDAIIGCVTETGEQGACVARAAVLAAGWPIEIPGVSLNRFCGSGQTAVNLAAQGAASGAYDLVYAGGVESMSRCPMGSDMGPLPPSLTERYNLVPQGISAEMIAERWNYSREQLDRFALESQRRAWRAIQEGRFKDSLVPVTDAPQPDGSGKTVEVDEHPRPQTTLEGLMALKPSFRADGKIHAGNSSGIVDGASGVLIASGRGVDELERQDKSVGLCTMCIGYGMGIATIIERV